MRASVRFVAARLVQIPERLLVEFQEPVVQRMGLLAAFLPVA
jgi:hypothetical protein